MAGQNFGIWIGVGLLGGSEHRLCVNLRKIAECA